MNTTHQAGPTARQARAAWLRALLAAMLVAALATLGTVVGAGAASADTGNSFPGCPQLDEGDTGPCVAQLQQKLTEVLPAYNLPGSEVFGPSTRIALLDFQGRNRLGADGRFGTTTARELQRQYDAVSRGAVASPQSKPVETTSNTGSSLPGCPQLDLGDTAPCVAQLQNLLTKVHPEYQLPGSQTYGPQTEAAVRDFQERNHITGGNGQFGPGTAKELQRQADAAGTPTTPATGSSNGSSSGSSANDETAAAGEGAVSAAQPASSTSKADTAQGTNGAERPCLDEDSVVNQYTGECQSPEAGVNDGGSGAVETIKTTAQCTWEAAGGTEAAKKAGKVLWKGKKLPKKGDVVDGAKGFLLGKKKFVAPVYIVGCAVLDPTNK